MWRRLGQGLGARLQAIDAEFLIAECPIFRWGFFIFGRRGLAVSTESRFLALLGMTMHRDGTEVRRFQGAADGGLDMRSRRLPLLLADDGLAVSTESRFLALLGMTIQ